MKNVNVLAADYGASNGRCIIGSFDGSRLVLQEIHRFPNNMVLCNTGMYWDILALFNELKKGLAKSKALSIPLSSMGIDTWALDFGVIDSQGNLIGYPHSYRDNRVNDVVDEVFNVFPEYEIFSKTGILPDKIFTLFQIVSMKYKEKAILEKGDTFLFMPNLLSFLLTGCRSCDSTQASSSLLYNPLTKSWISEFAQKLGISNLFPEVKAPGSVIGTISNKIADEIGMDEIPVISVASHDTASAIAAVPEGNKCDVVYISCGTWSVIGTSLLEPIITMDAMTKGFNNEIGYNDEIMFVKNITGLWILQECEKEWAGEGYSIDYKAMVDHASNSSFASFIDVACSEFAQPGNMTNKIIEHCKLAGRQSPENKEEIFMCIVHGLAKKYKETVEQLSSLTGKKFSTIHIIGGGARNSYLCEMISRLTGARIVAGPYEAAAVGNIMAQLIALGEVKDLGEAVEIIKRSFPLKKYSCV